MESTAAALWLKSKPYGRTKRLPKVLESGFSLMTLVDFRDFSDLNICILPQKHKTRYSEFWPDGKTSSYTAFEHL